MNQVNVDPVVANEQVQTSKDTCCIPDELHLAYRHLVPLIVMLKQLSVTNTDANVQIECKIVLGKHDRKNNSFNTNIPAVFYQNILAMLQRYDGWLSVLLSEDVHDYYYANECKQPVKSLRRKYNKKNRNNANQPTSHPDLEIPSETTAKVINTDVSADNCSVKTHVDFAHRQKACESTSTVKIIRTRTLFKSDASAVQNGLTINSLSIDHTYTDLLSSLLFKLDEFKNIDVNIYLQKKHTVKSQLLPRIVLPQMMRIVKRTTFCLANWRFIFTSEWVAPTRAEAEFNQSLSRNNRTLADDETINVQMLGNKDLCVHKIKIELIGSKKYILETPTDYLALSLLFKICSLLRGSIFSINPITT